MMNESQVREAIDGLIEQQERRMATYQGDSIIPDAGAISEIGHSIDALIHLKHTLRLCGCPPEVNEKRDSDRQLSAVFGDYCWDDEHSGGWDCKECRLGVTLPAFFAAVRSFVTTLESPGEP